MTTAAVEPKQQSPAVQPGVALSALAAAAPGGGVGATATTSASLVPPLEAQLAASRASLLHPQAFFVSWQVNMGSWVALGARRGHGGKAAAGPHLGPLR